MESTLSPPTPPYPLACARCGDSCTLRIPHLAVPPGKTLVGESSAPCVFALMVRLVSVVLIAPTIRYGQNGSCGVTICEALALRLGSEATETNCVLVRSKNESSLRGAYRLPFFNEAVCFPEVHVRIFCCVFAPLIAITLRDRFPHTWCLQKQAIRGKRA